MPAVSQKRAVPVRTAAYWLTPVFFCVVLYWYGLRAVYQMDDFAWLALQLRVHDVRSFVAALFQPFAQGTIRPWSERLFFMANWTLFGMYAAPARAVVFLTQFANLVLLTAITRRLTGSALAGFVAPLLWLCNSNIYIPMAWTAAYNQIQCAFFLLLALLLWIRYTDTGERRYYVWQWVVFLFGFGALEINVVYPAIAALYAICFARTYVKRTLPMFGVSLLYAILHRAVAPAMRSDTYRMYFDSGIWSTLGSYIRWTFGPDRLAAVQHWPVWPLIAAEALAGCAFAAFAVATAVRKQWLALFGVGWFFITLSPVLPLRNHVSDYYLTIPSIGLAIAAAWAIAVSFRKSRTAAAIAVAGALLYAIPSAIISRRMTREYFDVSRRARTFIRSVAYADRLHPDKTLVIRNVDNDLFWAAWWDNPFQLFGRRQIFLAPESEADIVPMSKTDTLSRFVMPAAETLEGMRSGNVVTYDVLPGGRLRNITLLYRSMLDRETSLELPKFIDLGQPLSSAYLGDGWWQAESTFRWMSKRAQLRIHGPSGGPGELIVRGNVPLAQVQSGPVHLTVTADGHRFASSTITAQNLQFEFRYALTEATTAKPVLNVTLDVDRTFQAPGDQRELGVAVGSVEVVP